MEYVFGTDKTGEILRTKGRGSLTTGHCQVNRHYTDQDITDTFYVVEKYRTKTDDEGNHYNWYRIKNHYRYVDRFSPGIVSTEQEITEQDIALLEAGQEITELDLRVLELELKAQEV